jgi:Flp pilus assembly protein TadD
MAKQKPLAKGKVTSSPLTKAQINGFEETDRANKTLKVAICIFLMVATFCIYSQVQNHEFVSYDDQIYTQNLNVKAGLTSESVKWAFTTTYSEDWSPVNWLSHILDYQLYGMHPKGHHLTSLFFHIANALLLFMVLHRMTGALWQSGFVAAMFAFHPLNVESVAWAAERKNVLSTLFWLLTMWAYIHYAAKPTIKRYGLVFLFFTLGLMSKAMLVTLPFVLLLMDYWPLRRLKFAHERSDNKITEKNTAKRSEAFRLVLEKIPLFSLSVVFSIISFIAATKSLQAFSVPLKERIIHSQITYLAYLQKMFWPSKLSSFYPYPENALSVTQGIFCGMVLVGITFISIKLIRKAPYFAVGWFWYLGTLVPVIGIFVQAGEQAMADRYAYVPLIGIFIIVAWGLPELMAKWHHKKKVLSISAGILIPTLMVMTWTQVGHWKNSITIFKHDIKVTDKKYPNFAVVHNNLGIALVAKGNNEEAISHYKMAIKIKPYLTTAHYNLGNALFAKRKGDEAISHYKIALKIKPDYALAHNNLGNALSAERKIEEAISHYKMAIKIKPDYALAHYNLGIALVAEGKNEEATSHYKMAIKLKPDYDEAHYNLGNALSAERKIEEAISHYKMAIRLNPYFTNAHYNLGIILIQKGALKEAVYHFRETVRLRPDLVKAGDYLKYALLQSQELE